MSLDDLVYWIFIFKFGFRPFSYFLYSIQHSLLDARSATASILIVCMDEILRKFHNSQRSIVYMPSLPPSRKMAEYIYVGGWGSLIKSNFWYLTKKDTKYLTIIILQKILSQKNFDI